MTLIQAERVDDLVQSMMACTARATPARLAALGQRDGPRDRYHAVPVIADAYFKG